MIGLAWVKLMEWLGKLSGSDPLVASTIAAAAGLVVSRLVLIAIWWTVAYVIFEVLL